jgi:hypothetical protein
MIRKRELTIAITHKTAFRLRRVDQWVHNGVNRSCVYFINSSVASRSFPFIWDESSVDAIDLVKLEHGRILIEYAWLW